MTVYQYIAQSNPDAANEICNKYGFFEVQNMDEIAQCLSMIVQQNDDGSDNPPAFVEIMNLHPDKDTLVALFDKKKDDTVVAPTPPAPVEKDCSCSSNKVGADGTTSSVTGNSILVNKTNALILGSAFVIFSFAVIFAMKTKA